MTPEPITLDLSAATEAEVFGGGENDGAGAKTGGKPKRDRSRSSRSRRPSKIETDLRSGVSEVIDRLVEIREGHNDGELADALREQRDAMASGIVALARQFRPLRIPLLVLVGFLRSTLGFWKVARILAGRLGERRIRQAEERAAAEDVLVTEAPAPVA